MIYSVVLVNSRSRRKIVSYDYFPHKGQRAQLLKYLSLLSELREKSDYLRYRPTIIDDSKFTSRDCNDDTVLIYITDVDELDTDIISSINRTARIVRNLCKKKSISYVKENFIQIVDQYVHSRIVIALVGESGVGKTSLLYLLMGKQPPDVHIPTIAINTEVIENIRFANYELTIIDFAGQQQSRKLWDFSSIDMVFLVTDSTLKNIIASKAIFSDIIKEYPEIPVIVFANKQDLPNALDPSAISKVLGTDTHSMVAVDIAYRNELLKSLATIFCDYFDLEIPDDTVTELVIDKSEQVI